MHYHVPAKGQQTISVLSQKLGHYRLPAEALATSRLRNPKPGTAAVGDSKEEAGPSSFPGATEPGTGRKSYGARHSMQLAYGLCVGFFESESLICV